MIDAIKKLVRRLGDQKSGAEPGPHKLHLAAAALMVETARADHVLEEAEERALRTALISHLQLSEEECESLLAIAHNEAGQLVSYHPFTQAINENYGTREKLDIIKMMWVIALADNDLDKYERHLIHKIANLIYLTREQVIWARYQACEQLGLDPDEI